MCNFLKYNIRPNFIVIAKVLGHKSIDCVIYIHMLLYTLLLKLNRKSTCIYIEQVAQQPYKQDLKAQIKMKLQLIIALVINYIYQIINCKSLNAA